METVCLYCENPLVVQTSWRGLFFPEEKEKLCQTCTDKLARITGEICPICNRSFTDIKEIFIKNGMCGDCVRWEADEAWHGVLLQNNSLYLYNDFFKELLARFKYRGDYVLAKVFSEEIKAFLKNKTVDAIVPIPLSEERLFERGFNQAHAMADAAGFKTAELLTRTHSEKQSKKSRAERIHLEQVFQVANASAVKGSSILLMDDIYTTGSTLRHAAKVLKEAGAKEVCAFTLARG